MQDVLFYLGVISTNDLHIWQTGSHNRFLSAHIIVDKISQTERIKIMDKIMKLVREKYNIYHTTLQIVSEQEIKEIDLACLHCN